MEVVKEVVVTTAPAALGTAVAVLEDTAVTGVMVASLMGQVLQQALEAVVVVVTPIKVAVWVFWEKALMELLETVLPL
jgi:hypothetical protein